LQDSANSGSGERRCYLGAKMDGRKMEDPRPIRLGPRVIDQHILANDTTLLE